AVCLTVAVIGMRRVLAQAALAGGEAELAVLRVVVDTLLFGYVLAGGATAASRGEFADTVPVAAAALLTAWLVLLCVIRWPVVPALRLNAMLGFDALIFSAFLHLGGGAVAGCYPLYFVLILYVGLRFGLVGLVVSAGAGVFGFAVVILSTESW